MVKFLEKTLLPSSLPYINKTRGAESKNFEFYNVGAALKAICIVYIFIRGFTHVHAGL
jgi:hypothetical protein